MEEFTLENDILVFCLTAKSFAEGVVEAHDKLYALVPYSHKRKYFGLSRPENGIIVYKAAAEEMETGEFRKYGLEEFTIKRGKYMCITVKDFIQNVPAIGKAFEKLIALPGIDPEGYCVEWYLLDKDVKCMVRLK